VHARSADPTSGFREFGVQDPTSTTSHSVNDCADHVSSPYARAVEAGFAIRPARTSDAAAIARVHVASWRIGYEGLLAPELLEHLSVADRVRTWQEILSELCAAQDGRCVDIALSGNAIVGFVGAGPSREHDAAAGVGEIYALYIDPEHWSARVGRALLNRALAELRSLGLREVLLWVLATNERACHFYELAGFSRDGRARIERLVGVPDFDVEVEEVCYRRGPHDPVG
jgi:ribosomal protein S18 acetylase RimI-like enzyme